MFIVYQLYYNKAVKRKKIVSHIPVTLALGRLRQKDLEFQSSLGYMVSPDSQLNRMSKKSLHP